MNFDYPYPMFTIQEPPVRLIRDADSKYTPLAIEILLHYHCSPSEFERLDAPACMATVGWAMEQGLLRLRETPSKYGSNYEGTERLAALVKAWCSTPLPEQVWALPLREQS